ncbi:MAG: amidohydrolase family protein, partial [Candidatus Latescibacteria bacterium]|nr:amidohydrolase family protein [Candidatus Latescibacterota bacterium]
MNTEITIRYSVPFDVFQCSIFRRWAQNKMGKKRLLIRGARVIDPANRIDRVADILIEEGKIGKIGEPRPQSLRDIEVLEAQGKVVLPGLIDMHVHLRQPGGEAKETILSGCEAAAAGGFTALACMPNTQPPVDSPEHVRWIISQGQEAKMRVYPIAAITKGRRGEELSDISRLLEAGAVAFSDDGDPVDNPQLMLSALKMAKQLDALLISHAEEKALTQGGQMNEGQVAAALGLKGIPGVAEYIGVARDIALAEY